MAEGGESSGDEVRGGGEGRKGDSGMKTLDGLNGRMREGGRDYRDKVYDIYKCADFLDAVDCRPCASSLRLRNMLCYCYWTANNRLLLISSRSVMVFSSCCCC